MKTFGETLREAREQKGVTISDAAAATRIKAVILEELEKNRVQRAHAPIYAKGFIRIYSEYLELDPEILLNAYEAQRSTTPAEGDKPLDSRRRSDAKPKSGQDTRSFPSIPWSRIGETLKNSGRSVIQGLRRIPVSAWRQGLARKLQAAKFRMAAGTVADDEPDGASEPSPSAERRSWQQQLHQAVRGRYRMHAAVTVMLLLLLILILAVSHAVRRRHPEPDESVHEPRIDPAETAPGIPPIEFTHEPPPPYYR